MGYLTMLYQVQRSCKKEWCVKIIMNCESAWTRKVAGVAYLNILTTLGSKMHDILKQPTRYPTF
jgi:hypothetical protein